MLLQIAQLKPSNEDVFKKKWGREGSMSILFSVVSHFIILLGQSAALSTLSWCGLEDSTLNLQNIQVKLSATTNNLLSRY